MQFMILNYVPAAAAGANAAHADMAAWTAYTKAGTRYQRCETCYPGAGSSKARGARVSPYGTFAAWLRRPNCDIEALPSGAGNLWS
jgi:hypothetical protein